MAHQKVNIQQYTEVLLEQFTSAEEAANAFTELISKQNKAKEDMNDELVTVSILGGSALKEWNEDYDALLNNISEAERHLEELKAFIAVGFPACLNTNASFVEDEYKRKMVIYNARQSGLTVPDDHQVWDWDDPMGIC